MICENCEGKYGTPNPFLPKNDKKCECPEHYVKILTKDELEAEWGKHERSLEKTRLEEGTTFTKAEHSSKYFA